jgi:hypothetical protein
VDVEIVAPKNVAANATEVGCDLDRSVDGGGGEIFIHGAILREKGAAHSRAAPWWSKGAEDVEGRIDASDTADSIAQLSLDRNQVTEAAADTITFVAV